MVRGAGGQLFYDPQKNAWLDEKITPVGVQGSGMAFYDPANNAHYYFRAGDSREKGVIWVYRYKKAPRK